MMFLTMQGGILGPFAWLFGKLLDFIYNLLAGDNGIANLGFCIIIFTVIVKIILLPLTIKQQKSTKINAIIQPELSKIQKKYKNKKDQESMLKQQQEIQAVYDKYGTSMTGGCLTTLIQFPIIMGLYRVIQNVPAYVGKIKDMYSPIANAVIDSQGVDKAQQFIIDFVSENKVSSASYAINKFEKLSEIDVDNIIDVLSNFGISNLNTLIDTIKMTGDNILAGNVEKIDTIHSFILGINISEAPGYHLSWALCIPFLSAFFNYLSMKVTTGKQDQQMEGQTAAMMKSMQITMPLMSVFIGISMPAGIGIYWTMNAFLSLLTQIGINFYYDHADMDEILKKQMEKAEKKRKKNGGKKSFMERMMENSEAAQEELEKREAMRKNAVTPLKSYVPSKETQQTVENSQKKQYKSGSIGAKANIMLSYNNSNQKEEK
ncbi:MAG: YidC/Oxa1 family membrane protein insertase [Lachnospiraceae bacterium]|nr:YidC/Oxa1 family membrane protein insertase [Lachnospiraceae bacterium]